MTATIGRAPERLLRDTAAGDRRETIRKALLACGVLSSLLYIVATDGIAAAQWAGYSRTTQMVSDLFAVGSPGRPALLVLVGGGYTASAHENRFLRRTGAALVAYGISNVIALPFPLTLGSDASVPMHIVATNLQLVLMLAAIGFGAAAFGGRLRVYSVATLVTTTVTGLAAFMSAPAGPSLVLGIGERISIGAFLLWVAVLAVTAWHSPEDGDTEVDRRRRRNVLERSYDWVYERCTRASGRSEI